MRRRNFLKLLGVAPVAAPIAGHAAVTQAANGVLPSVAVAGAQVGMEYVPEGGGPGGMDWARKELLKLIADPDGFRRRIRAERSVHMLDPDLAAMHSLSMHHRMRIQLDRNVERALARERSWLERIIETNE